MNYSSATFHNINPDKPTVSINASPVEYASNTQQPYLPPGSQIHYVQPFNVVDPSIAGIRDWLPWSIINIFLGGIILGLIPLMFSISCRERKRMNDALGAESKSKLALIFNIIVSLVGLGLWIAIIVLIAQSTKTVCSVYDIYCR